MGNLFTSIKQRLNPSPTSLCLQDQIDALKKENEVLRKEVDYFNGRRTIKDVIDEEQIKLTAEKLIKDKDVNLKYLPDFIERRFYESIIKIFLALIKETCDTTKLSILGHEIDIILQKKEIRYPIQTEEYDASNRQTEDFFIYRN